MKEQTPSPKPAWKCWHTDVLVKANMSAHWAAQAEILVQRFRQVQALLLGRYVGLQLRPLCCLAALSRMRTVLVEADGLQRLVVLNDLNEKLSL